MANYITTHLRDGKQVSFEEWNKMLKEDLAKENERLTWDISGAVYSDLGNGRDIELNGHFYERRTNILYDSARELFDDLMSEGQYDVIFDTLKEMTEKEIYSIVSRMNCVIVKDEKLLLKDEKDW